MYPTSRTNLFGLGIDRISIYVRFAPTWIQKRSNNPHRRCLTSTVWPDEAKHVPGLEALTQSIEWRTSRRNVWSSRAFSINERLLGVCCKDSVQGAFNVLTSGFRIQFRRDRYNES